MFARGRNDPDARRTAVPDISAHIDFHAIWSAGSAVGIHVDEQAAICHRAIRPNVIGVHLLRPDIVDVQSAFVGRKSDAVRRIQFAVQQRQPSVFQHVNAGMRHAFRRVLVTRDGALANVGEPD